ncbi:DUF6907 domain-containing protein [Streptomyces sp. UG1]|uniref:DUF6907 domain-containing protein n=1 Tax=Streptomyces sp. UG1 TaxID=3417652 RepID=UPI003CE770B5
MTEPRTVTVHTLDHGPVTFTCPTWCASTHDDEDGGYRTDISHDTPEIQLTVNGRTVGHALISQAPYAERGTRAVQAFVTVTYGEDGGYSPAGMYDLAAAMDGHADRLRDLADQLARILAEAGQ